MTVRTIYPKNQATGTGNDTDTFIAAHAACNPGDTILMKAVAQGTSTPTPWMIAKPHGQGADLPIYLPNNESFLWYQDWMQTHLTQTTECLAIDRNVTVRGEVDGEGKPITVLRQFGSYEDFSSWWAGANVYVSNLFVLQKNVHPRFENLKIQYSSNPFILLMPFDVVNCEFDGVGEALNPVLDDRYVFPHLQLDPSNFSDMQTTLIKDCVFKRCYYCMYGIGSGIVLEGCSLAGADAIAGGVGAYFIGMSNAVSIFSGGVVPPNKHVSRYAKYNICRNNNFDFGGNDLGWIATLGFWGDGNISGDGICEDNEMYGNEISNLAGFGLECFAANRGINRRNSVYDNTMTRVQCPIDCYGMTDDFGNVTMPTDNMFTNNTIIDVLHAPEGSNWGSKSPGFLMYQSRNCQTVKNDWTQSQLPPLSNTVGTYESGMALDGAQSCVISESGKWPVGQGGTINFVTDINGYKNRIVGGKASGAERPAGIGKYMSSKFKQGRDLILAKKHGKGKPAALSI